ncbi:MAG: hypothetical protein QXM27_03200 [Candidatus Pacearchaeota archaeon]
MKKLTIIVLALLTLITILPCIYFWSTQLSWDMHGHFFSSYFIKKYLWPSFSGWNNLSLTGYPQNYFYPPLFHWIVASLGFIMPLEIAFKLMVSLSLILLPIVIYLALRNLKFDEDEAILATLFIYLFFPIMKGDIGGDFYSTLHVGLVTYQFGFFLFFCFLTVLDLQFLNKKRNLLAALLASMALLSNIFMIIIILIFLLIFAILNIKTKKQLINFIVMCMFIFSLIAFWAIPFFKFMAFTKALNIPGGMPPLHPFLLSLMIVSIIIITIKNDKKSFLFILLAIIFLVLTIFGSFMNLTLHFFRFHSINYFLFGILLSRFFIITPFKKYHKFICIFLTLLCIGLVIIFTGALSMNDVISTLNMPIIKKLVEKENGYGIVISTIHPTRSQHAIANYFLLNNIAMVDGLFVESSFNSRAINSLKKELNRNAFTWGVPNYYINESEIIFLLPYHIKYLGISFLFLDNWTYQEKLKIINPNEIYEVDVGLNENISKFYLLKVNNSLFEIVNNLHPVNKKDFEEKTEKWWSDRYLINYILVESDYPLPEYDINGINASIKILEKKNDYIKIFVDSPKEVFVLIKISYFPNWHAFSNNKEIKIYRASPNFMVIYGKDIIELKFVRSWIEILSLIISLLALILLFCLLFFNFFY